MKRLPCPFGLVVAARNLPGLAIGARSCGQQMGKITRTGYRSGIMIEAT
jgi:hypothetical protein